MRPVAGESALRLLQRELQVEVWPRESYEKSFAEFHIVRQAQVYHLRRDVPYRRCTGRAQVNPLQGMYEISHQWGREWVAKEVIKTLRDSFWNYMNMTERILDKFEKALKSLKEY